MCPSRPPQALEVADAVAVAVGERAHVDLVHDGPRHQWVTPIDATRAGTLALDDGGVGPARRDAVADPLDGDARPP